MGTKDDIKNLLHDFQAGPTGADRTHALIRGGVQAVPLVGGLAAEFYAMYISPPLEERSAKLITLITEELIRVKEQMSGFSFENLQDNDAFVSAVATALPIGMRTHRREKHEALRNAVVNVALESNPSETLQMVFLNLIEIFGPEHWRILEYCIDPLEYAQRKGVITAEQAAIWRERDGEDLHKKRSKWSYGLFKRTFPELHGQTTLINAIVNDLYSRSMVRSDEADQSPRIWPDTPNYPGSLAVYTTEAGKEFLDFIKSPLEKDIHSE